MAGEWIALDCNLATKPEVLELVDVTGLPVEVVGWRLIQLWSWAAMNTADGQIVATPRRLVAVAGGDEQFWLAVERVGWISFVGSTMSISGWERRFSRAAKARATHASRQDTYRRRSRDGTASQGGDGTPSRRGGAAPSLQDRTGQERREEEIQPAAPVPTSKPPAASSSRAKHRVSWSAESGWHGITDADLASWSEAFPGAVISQELAKANAWLIANPKRCGKRNWRKFLVGWLSRCQDKGGTIREPGNRAGPPPVDQAKRRFYRADAGRQMTDGEYAVWKRDRSSGGMVAALASGMRLTQEP